MKKIINTVLIVFTLGFSASSFAASEWSDWYPISQIYSHGSLGSVLILLKPGSAHPNPGNCSSSSWLSVRPENKNFKEIYQMALTAQASGMKVNASVSGCNGSYPKVIHLRTLSN